MITLFFYHIKISKLFLANDSPMVNQELAKVFEII